MSMQDNEFDELFRAKLDGFEIKPSAPVWDNIDAGLNGKKRRIAILPWLSIAASIIVLITAGILFVPQTETIKRNRPDKNQMAQSQQISPSISKPAANNTFNISVMKGQNINAVQLAAAHTNKSHHGRKQELPVVQQFVDPELPKTVKVDEQPILADAPPKKDGQIKAVVPDAATPLVNPTAINATNEVQQQQPVLAAVQLPAATDNKSVKQPVKHHGIHNMGDLINLVVAKVDKRKDKIIQFSDGEEESTITGVHIGAIDIKKEAK